MAIAAKPGPGYYWYRPLDNSNDQGDRIIYIDRFGVWNIGSEMDGHVDDLNGMLEPVQNPRLFGRNLPKSPPILVSHVDHCNVCHVAYSKDRMHVSDLCPTGLEMLSKHVLKELKDEVDKAKLR